MPRCLHSGLKRLVSYLAKRLEHEGSTLFIGFQSFQRADLTPLQVNGDVAAKLRCERGL